jgi:sugar-specific transcriptional regulator TrmB
MDDATLEIYVFLAMSLYRSETVKSLLRGDKTPTEISKDINIRVNHISNVLIDLRKYDLVECINNDKRKYRVYRLTPRGRYIGSLLK